MKKQNGITLIALVISIIIIVILASVSINTLIGDNGILVRASNAKKTMEIETAKEEIELALLGLQVDKRKNNEYCSLEYVRDNIEKDLPEIVIVGGKGNPISKLYVKQNNHQFEIRLDGEVVYIGDVSFSEVPDLAIVMDKTSTGVDKVTLELLGDVEIGSIKKIITPTGEIDSTNGTYEITENGEYEFTIITDKNIQITKKINIQNIKEKGIDLTEIISTEGDTHNHIYESKSNATKHWEQCFMCNHVKNEESHNAYITVSGTGTCDSYLTKSCSKCGYIVSNEYVYHIIHEYTKEELEMLENKTNINTYYHEKGKCKVCNSTSAGGVSEIDGTSISTGQDCYDSEGKRITCTNRGVCAGCNYDYSTTAFISHESTSLRNDKKTYYCHYCDTNVYKVFNSWYEQDKSNENHYTLYGIFQLEDGINWKASMVATYSPQLSVGAVNLTPATILDLPPEYYNNGQYGTTGINSGLYLVSYEATITDGYQGKVDVRLNADNCFGNINGSSIEYGKTYAIGFSISPDITAPSDLIATVSGNGEENKYSTNVYITASCIDNYSDTVKMALYDSKDNCIVDYKSATMSDGRFSYVFNITNAGVEISENQNYYVYFKDRFDNLSKKEINVSYIDTKAPTIVSLTGSSTEWSIRKSVKIEAIDNGSGNVSIAFNDSNTYESLELINGKYTKVYNFIGDVYEDMQGIIYLKDGLGNMRTERVNIGKIDSTSPRITNVSRIDNTLKIEANDINSKLNKTGSGIIGYAISPQKELPGEGAFQDSNVFKLDSDITYYVWVKDAAGNISERYQVN